MFELSAVVDRPLLADRADLLRDAVDRVRRLDCTGGVWAVGSLAAGLQHAYSDVDLFVACLARHEHDLELYETEHGRVDIEWRTLDRLTDYADRYAEFTITGTNHGEFDHPAGQWDDVARLHTGVLVHQTPDVARAAELLATRRDVFRRTLVSFRTWESMGTLEDHAGFRRCDDHGSAEFLAAELEVRALELLCFGFDDLYLGRKWLPQKLGRLGLYATMPDDRRPPTIARLQALFGLAQLVAVGSASRETTLALLTEPVPARSVGPIRNPRVFPWVTAEGVRFCDVETLFTDGSERLVRPAALALWLCFDGGPQEESIDRFVRLFGHGRGGVSQAATAQASHLVAHDLLAAA